MVEPVNLDDIKSIIAMIKEADDVAEFTLKYGDVEISLSREGRGAFTRCASVPFEQAVTQVSNTELRPSTPVEAAPSTVAATVSPNSDEVVITAPMVGTFYRAPKPGEPPFTDVGKTVTPDSVVCIIEVMKLMNSLPAGVEGTVTRILVEDSQAVEYGQPLMYIKKAV